MKKYPLIIMLSLILFTGCMANKEDVKNLDRLTEPTTPAVEPDLTTEKTTTTTTTTSTTTKTTTTSKKTTTTKKLTEDEVYKAMIALKSKYPDGTKWTNDNKYVWKASNRKNYTGYGCAAFAFMLSDAAFGTAPASKHTNVNKIRVGDILRIYGDSHSVVVLKITSDSYIVAQGNMNSAVYWYEEIPKNYINSQIDYIYTRW